MADQSESKSPASSPSAEEVKERGNALLKAKDFQGALQCYTQAIALDAKEPKFHSNRALALTKLGRFAEAVRDCDAALAIDRDFLKPHYYKANALLKLQNPDGSRKEASAALAKNPPEPLKATLEKLVVNATAAAASQTGFFKSLVRAVPTMRLFAVLCALVYMIPLPISYSPSAYRFALFNTFGTLAIEIYATHGKPWGMVFMQKVLDPQRRYLDYKVHCAVITAFLIVSKPYAIGLMTVMAMQLAQSFFYDIPRMLPGSVGARASEFAHNSLYPYFVGQQNAHSSMKWAQLQVKIQSWTAYTEVFLGIFLLFELFTPGRALLQTVLLWQMLRTVAMFCQQVRDAFYSVDQSIRATLGRIPVAGGYYGRLSNYLRSWGDLPTQEAQQTAAGGGGGGFMQRAASSCNIM